MDNRSKAVLDDVALKMQQDPNLNAVLTGSADSGEPRSMGLQRAQNAMAYLTKPRGSMRSASDQSGNRTRTQSRSLDSARRSYVAGSDACTAATRHRSAGAAARHRKPRSRRPHSHRQNSLRYPASGNNAACRSTNSNAATYASAAGQLKAFFAKTRIHRMEQTFLGTS